MRPYLALIKDSFRAAIASKVLYVLLALITILLAGLAPLHVKEILDWRINFGSNVHEQDRLAIRLVERGENSEYPAIRHVWNRLDSSTRTDLTKLVESLEGDSSSEEDGQQALTQQRTYGDLESNLNKLIKDRTFYDEAAWASKRHNPEVRDLLEQGVSGLSKERSRRLNRLLMASAFPGIIQRGSSTALDLRYAVFKWEDLTFNMSYSQFSTFMTTTITYVFDKFILSIGLFIAILVTSNMIPETFQPGSLNLLLSKPISRFGLLLSKFIGGCAFVSLCAAYMFLGLWLWLGLAMGIWQNGILWGIPLYIIVFAIYYSISTLVGLWSRSAILAVIMTAVFWAFCFGVGTAHKMIANRLVNYRSVDVMAINDKIVRVGNMNSVEEWNESKGEWENRLEMKMIAAQKVIVGMAMFVAEDDGSDGPDRLGPVYDAKTDQVLMGMIDLANPSSMTHQELYVAQSDRLDFKSFGKLPRNSIAVFEDPDGVIAVQSSGKYFRFNGSPPVDEKAKKSGKNGKKKPTLFGSLFDRAKTIVPPKGQFDEISPKKDRVAIFDKRRVTYNSATREIVTFKDAEMTRFALNEKGIYEKKFSKEIDTGHRRSLSSIISASGDTIVLALGNGKVITLDGETLEKKQEYLPQQLSKFRSIKASKDGRYFVLGCRNNTIWLLDKQKPDAITMPSVAGQETISAFGFDNENRLWVGNYNVNAGLYDLDKLTNARTIAPKKTLLAKIYYYAVDPFYTVCPKPGEFYKVIAHVSAASRSTEAEGKATDSELRNLSASDRRPWLPLWSGLLFMACVLLVSGVIFQFRDY